MKKTYYITVVTMCLAVILFFSNTKTQAQAEVPYKVVVHPSNPVSSINRDELAKLFLKKSATWKSGTKAVPVDQKSSSKVRHEFSKDILKRSVSAVKAYWQQKIFSGLDLPPPQKSNDHAVLSYVSANKGAVGYVSVIPSTSKVKLLRIRN